MTDPTTWFETTFSHCRVMAILRGLGVEGTLRVAATAWDLGLHCVEVPIQSPRDVEALRATVEAGRIRGQQVGAGTVKTREQVRQAVESGAAFTVSPGLDLDVVRWSLDAGLPSLPGVATASEVHTAERFGLTWLKAFPAADLGPGWFQAMRGPYPDVRLVATGGMDASNAAVFLHAGARVVAVGSALTDPAPLGRLAALAVPGPRGPVTQAR